MTRSQSTLEEPDGPSNERVRQPIRFWLIIRTTGELLLTVGLLALFFVLYQLVGVPVEMGHAQRQLDTQLHQSWQPAGTSGHAPGQDTGLHQSPAEGTPFARLYLPKLGLSWTAVQGVSRASLHLGPGHYPATAMPGQVGNFALAGHRIRGLFFDLDEIGPGDTVIVETEDAVFTYRVYQTLVVAPTALDVIAPNPDQPDARPAKAVLTLTTCNPKWHNYQRLIVHAQLETVRAK